MVAPHRPLPVFLGLAVAALLAGAVAAATGADDGRAAEAARRIDSALAGDAAEPASDSEFLRRAYLDLLARPPSRPEAITFLDDRSEGKRAALVDRLLDDPAWADVVARRTMDHLFGDPDRVRVRAEGKTLSPAARDRAVAAFRGWLTERIRSDTPWPEIVAALVDAEGPLAATPEALYKASFFSAGAPALNIADGMSRQLLGIRISCARCHDHPFDRWKKEDYYRLAAFAARVRAAPGGAEGNLTEEVTLSEAGSGELVMPGTKKVASPRFLTGGGRPGTDGDRMGRLARILAETKAGRMQAAKAVVNREWAYLLGRGFVEPVDDFNRKNEPADGRAFDLLVSEFERHGESLRFLHRTILLSDAYARSSRGGGGGPFAAQGVRPLTPEQLCASILTAIYGFDGPVPLDRPPYSTLRAQFLKEMRGVFGAGTPFTITTPLPANARQSLWLRNGDWLAEQLGLPQGLLGEIYRLDATPDRVEACFLAVLGRRPTYAELVRFSAVVEEGTTFQTAWEDAIWALLNSTEFQTRH